VTVIGIGHRVLWFTTVEARPGSEDVVWCWDGERAFLARYIHGFWCRLSPERDLAWPNVVPEPRPVTHWAYVRAPAAPHPLWRVT
jgi:hypothetical protein